MLKYFSIDSGEIMEKNKKVELSSIEAAAYWWVKIIKERVRELLIRGVQNKQEEKFVEVFYNYTEVEWRNLYLELITYITEDVNNYIVKETLFGVDAFGQDTAKKGHNRLNSELSAITKCHIPDIRLAGDGYKDSVLYVNIFGSSVWYKSCGITDLPSDYEPSYIITGDKKTLDFYNLFISTIALLDEKAPEFKDIPIIRKRFSKEYKKLNNCEESIKEIEEMFNQAFDKASDKGLILGRYWRNIYFTFFKDIDFIGLEEFMELAEHYVDVILQRNRDEESNSSLNLNRKPSNQ